MAGIQEAYVTMTVSQRDALLDAVRLAKKRNTTQEYARDQVEQAKHKIKQEMALQKNAIERELTVQRSQLEKEIAMNRKAVTGAIEKISQMEETADNHQKQAQSWIEQANGLVEDIMQFRHELFASGELSKIQEEISNAEKDIRAQAFQSALAVGRIAFQNASDLKMRVINAENEWNKINGLWQQKLTLVSSDFAESAELVYEIDTTEGRERVTAALDYWANGKFKNALSRLDRLKKEMSDIDKLPIESIHCGLSELDRINDELLTVQKIGKENLMLSHNRYMMACFFAGILSDNFAMTDCEGDYEGSVPCHSYIGIYKNSATKDTIVVKIQPVPDDNGIMSKDRLEVHYFTVSNNEEQRRQWSKMIENELGRQGFNVGTFSDMKGYENCSSDQIQMTNIDWVRQKQVSI